MTTLDDLRDLDVTGLASLYESAPTPAIPTGCFRGEVLRWLPVPPGQSPLLRPLLKLGFERTPFGVDFDARRWWFRSPEWPRLGRFEPTVGPSRWRDATVLRLDYRRSRLPHAVRRRLYDEVVPLDQDLCLGIGGVNAPRGRGEQFFFALGRG